MGKPIIFIVGPTASGKTSAAIDLAKKINGEIICADSRTIYKGLNIGTAKPTNEEMCGIVHWGLDLVNPGERFSVAEFQSYAEDKIADIRFRGKNPIIVGGTGLYVDALMFGYNFKNNKNVNEFHDIDSVDRLNLKNESIVVGISTRKTELNSRIKLRSAEIFKSNVVKEAELVANKFGWDSSGMNGNIYPIIKKYKSGDISFDDMVQKFIQSDIDLAKRQMTWFRKNPYIIWCDKNSVENYVLSKFLSM